jgi:hypothetical protein
MRMILVLLALTVSNAFANEAQTALPPVQTQCVQTDTIHFGARARWKSCEVTRGRWFVTLDLVDQYQAQYCLGQRGQPCQRRALLLFANRAYTSKADVLLQRLDAGDTDYDDPQVVNTEYGDIMQLVSRRPGQAEVRRYYRWQAGQWAALAGADWQRKLETVFPPR